MIQTEILKRLVLAACTVLAANPVVLYLLLDSLLFATLLTLGALVLVQASYRPGKSRLLVAYALNLVILLGLCAHAEVVFDARFAEYAPENLYSVEDGYYFNLPYLAERFDDKEYTAHYFTNSQGFRIGEGQNPDEEVSTADWLFVGDSFTQGAQVEFEELYTTELYRYFPNKVIINAGISGFGIPQELRYYLDAGRKLNPSVVFLQISAFNDFMNVEEREAGFSDHLAQRSDFARFLLKDIKYTNPPELPLGRWTEPFYPDEEENRRYNVFYKEDDEKKRVDLQAVVDYLAQFKEAVEADGAELVVLFLPAKEQAAPRFFEEVVREFDLDLRQLDMSRPNRIVAGACDSLGIGLVDFTQVFQSASNSPFYEYDEHLNAFGHALMADETAKAIHQGDLPSVRLLGPSPEVLSRELVSDRYPIQYRSGGFISFQAIFDGNAEILLADSLFRDIQRLTFDDVDELHPMFSPDLSRVVYTEGLAESMETDVVEVRADGTGRRVLTQGSDRFGAIPSYNADGTAVAFAEWGYDGEGQYTLPSIVVVDLQTGEQRTISPVGEEAWRPVFDNIGRVAYIKRVNGQFDIFLFDPTSGQERQLTDTPYDEWDPSFAPDGTPLAYASRVDENWDLFALDPDEPARLLRLTHSRGDEWDPSFAPDGVSVLYAGHFGTMKGIFRLPIAWRQ